MTSALLMFLLSLIKAHSVSSFPSCPSSCVVCSDKAVICQRLGYIIDAPQTTQALLLTEGSISAVQPGALSDLRNVTVISLSHNRISVLDTQSFRNMPFLQTLLLDHNLLTSQALEAGALTNLTQLEVLALGNNRINTIHANLFKGTRSLRILKLEGNQITKIESSSFPLDGLRALESLDLSDNFIDYLEKTSFRGLISLMTLDLSRNRLQTAPVEAFSYLMWLNNLNLDLNSWNCSCQLLELAAFLSAFIQEPDKTLYNGRRMVCVSADNPAVTTVLELTQANCVPSNQNITVRVDTRGSVSPQLYVRDLAITGAICFVSGVGLTLLIVLIYCKMSMKKQKREQQNQEEVKEEGSSAAPNHTRNHIDTSERRKDFINGNGAVDARVGPRTVGNGGLFHCPECTGEEPVPNPVRWERMNGRPETLEEREKQRIRIEQDRRRIGPPQRNIVRDPVNKHLIGNSIDIEGQNRQDILHCGSCHRTYQLNQMDQNGKQARFHPNMRDTQLVHGIQQPRPNDWGRNNFYSDFDLRNVELKRETRNVTFNLGSPTRGQGEDVEGEEGTSPRGKDRRHKLQSSRSIKVKLNLNPLRKSKVHPKKKSDEKGSPRKSKDKSSEGKGKKDRKKSKKSKDCEKEESKKSEQESAGQETVAQVAPPVLMGNMQGLLGAQFRGGGGMLLGNRTTNLLAASGPQLPTSSLPFQGGNFMAQGKPMFPQSSTIAPNMNVSGPSMAPSGAPENIMRHPTMGRSASSNSLIANISQSKPTGLNTTPLQAAPVMLHANASITQASPITLQASAATLNANVAALQRNANLLQANPTLLQPNTTVQGSSTAKQATSLSPNASTQSGSTPKQARPTTLPASASSQNIAALANSAATSSVTSSVMQPDSKSQVSPKSSPRGKPNLTQEPQSSNKATSETPASPRKGSQTPAAGDSAPAMTMAENLSNTNSLAEFVDVTRPEGATELMMAVGGTQAADVMGSGVHGPTESADNASTTLIQQEYMSEDGASSPRRKLRLVIPEKTASRPPTALERKIR